MQANENAAQTTINPRDEWMIEEYMAKGFDRTTAEALVLINNNGQRIMD